MQIGAVGLSFVTMLFGVLGGGSLVANMLGFAGTLPETERDADETSPSQILSPAGRALVSVVDRRELKHGLIIGYLERLIVIAAITGYHFDALGFLIAAKGLIRSKELEHRTRAEYFLVGTLASMAVAVFCGLLIAKLFAIGWPELKK